jgi:NADPH:quinone reductase-like Zn-dependent oxidoreductase
MEGKMKAIVARKSGSPDVLELREIPKPVPKDDQLLIKVHAATVTAGDVIMRRMHPFLYLPLRLFGMKRKKTPGHEFTGVIESVGQNVHTYKIGDEIMGTTTGLSVGSNAEYICMPSEINSNVMAIKPSQLSNAEAASLPVGGMTAFQILKRGSIQPGQKVLIYGASGSVGTYAVQLAKYFGGVVTGVCSTRNVGLVKSLGAESVIDYTKENFLENGHIYDVIFDAVGKISESKCKDSLKESGRYLTVQTTTKEKLEEFIHLIDLVKNGEIKPVIDRSFPLEETAEAHRYVETGHKTGNVVITVTHND